MKSIHINQSLILSHSVDTLTQFILIVILFQTFNYFFHFSRNFVFQVFRVFEGEKTVSRKIQEHFQFLLFRCGRPQFPNFLIWTYFEKGTTPPERNNPPGEGYNDLYEGRVSGGSGLEIIQANAIRTLTFNHMLYYDRNIQATSSVME